MRYEKSRQEIINERLELIGWFIKSKHAHPAVDFDGMENLLRIRELACDIERYPRLEVHHLVEIVAYLDLQSGTPLKRKNTGPQVIVQEVVKEVKKPLSKAERMLSVGLYPGFMRDSLAQYDEEHPKATEGELVAVATNDLQVNELMNGIIGRIRGYRGSSHGQTDKRQQDLYDTFNKLKSQAKTPDDARRIERTILTKIDSFEDSSVR